jgi:Fe-Mn family superoxide dismutase
MPLSDENKQFPVVKQLPFAYDALDGAISEQAIRWHHQKGATRIADKLVEVQGRLEAVDRSKANPYFCEFGDIKRAQQRLLNALYLHQLFYDSLGGDGKGSGTRIHEQLREQFRNYEDWVMDFTACALASNGWAVLAWSKSEDLLRNLIVDEAMNSVWGITPLLAIDVSEQAFYYDHGPEREKYVAAILKRINWKAVDKRFIDAHQG